MQQPRIVYFSLKRIFILTGKIQGKYHNDLKHLMVFILSTVIVPIISHITQMLIPMFRNNLLELCFSERSTLNDGYIYITPQGDFVNVYPDYKTTK